MPTPGFGSRRRPLSGIFRVASEKPAPSKALSEALTAIGLEPFEQTRGALRAFINASTGAPPEAGASTDRMARIVLELHSRYELKRPGV